ncbi:cytochrome P450 [Cyathus striatus]|nr:cytochrome P450 [Cyathus striatus]
MAYQLDFLQASLLLTTAVVYYLYRYLQPKVEKNGLRGPPSPSFVYGVTKHVQQSRDPGAVYERWMNEYGPVYKVRAAFGINQVVVGDFKAIAHILGRDTVMYVRTPGFRTMLEGVVGKGVIWAEGDMHKRHRKALNPAFSTSVVKNLTSTFFEVTHKMTIAWDAILDNNSSDYATIEVQRWINQLSIDTIGIAGFEHDFGALSGQTSSVTEIVKMFSEAKFSGFSLFCHIVQSVVPLFGRLPTYRNRLFWGLSEASRSIMDDLFRKTKEMDGGDQMTSTLGIMVKAEQADSGIHMTQEEIMAQMKGIFIGGFDPPATKLSQWSLIELSRRPDFQSRLREELSQLPDAEPNWDQLETSLPFLDAVIWEVLRLHPSLLEITRMADEDDVLPLSQPILNNAREMVTQVPITKGQLVIIPLRGLNCAEKFNPTRWLDSSNKNEDLELNKRVLSFGDGPRICLGKAFTLTQMKVALTVLIRSYIFELPDGPGTEIESHLSLLPRPKVKGEIGSRVPLVVRRVR